MVELMERARFWTFWMETMARGGNSVGAPARGVPLLLPGQAGLAGSAVSASPAQADDVADSFVARQCSIRGTSVTTENRPKLTNLITR